METQMTSRVALNEIHCIKNLDSQLFVSLVQNISGMKGMLSDEIDKILSEVTSEKTTAVNAWQQLPDSIRSNCLPCLHDIDEFKSKNSVVSVLQAWQAIARKQRLNYEAGLTEMALLNSPRSKALWLLLHYPVAFDLACRFHEINLTGKGHWREFADIHADVVVADDSRLNELSRQLRQFFMTNQSRGQFCLPERYEINGKLVVTVNLSDYPEIDSEFDGSGALFDRDRQPVFQVCFVYDEGAGLLREYIKDVRPSDYRAVADMFCTVVLGLDGLPKNSRQATFNIQPLWQKMPIFCISPNLPVTDLGVIGVAYQPCNSEGITRVVKGQGKGLYQDLAKLSKEDRLYGLVQTVVMRAHCVTETGRTKNIQFTIRRNGSTTLGHSGIYGAVHKVLIDSGIEIPANEQDKACA